MNKNKLEKGYMPDDDTMVELSKLAYQLRRYVEIEREYTEQGLELIKKIKKAQKIEENEEDYDNLLLEYYEHTLEKQRETTKIFESNCNSISFALDIDETEFLA